MHVVSLTTQHNQAGTSETLDNSQIKQKAVVCMVAIKGIQAGVPQPFLTSQGTIGRGARSDTTEPVHTTDD